MYLTYLNSFIFFEIVPLSIQNQSDDNKEVSS